MESRSDQAPRYDTVEFVPIKFEVAQEFGKFMFEATDLKIEETVRSVLIRLKSEVLGQHNYQEYSVAVDIPSSWWQHLKRDHAPKWVTKRYPVKTEKVWRTVGFDHSRLFPYSSIYIPPSMGRVVMHSHPLDPDVIKK